MTRPPCLHFCARRFRKNVHHVREAIDLVLLPHDAMDPQERKTLTTVEDILHEAIPQEAIHVNAHQEEDVMMIMDETMEEGALLHHEDDWMMGMGMDRLPHEGLLTIMILTTDEDHLHLVVILTPTEVEIHMPDPEAHPRDIAADMVVTRMVDTQDVTGKFSIFMLLTGCPGNGVCHVEALAHFVSARPDRSSPLSQRSINTREERWGGKEESGRRELLMRSKNHLFQF
jgi:hypothetical protein